MRSGNSDALGDRNYLHAEPALSDLALLVAGIAAGAVAMFYFDSVSGSRRRALVRDKIVGAGHDAAHLVQARSKRAADRLKGLFVTRHLDRVTRSRPESDQQLHGRIRARLGRVISHPKSVHVEVHQGRVSLTGRILTNELDKLLKEVRHNVGVTAVDNQLVCHDRPQGIPELQGRMEPRGPRSGERSSSPTRIQDGAPSTGPRPAAHHVRNRSCPCHLMTRPRLATP